MADKDFSIYNGKFLCKKCQEEVNSLRFWTESGDTTWMCTKKHISKVTLITIKKKKADFENE
jgi:hypothetical protein